MKEQKKNYVKPSLIIQSITIEHGIAASSVMVSGGTGDTPYQPTIMDWEIGGTGYGSMDLFSLVKPKYIILKR